MVVIHQNKLEESTLIKMGVRICPTFWYQVALSRVLAHELKGEGKGGLLYKEDGGCLSYLLEVKKAILVLLRVQPQKVIVGSSKG